MKATKSSKRSKQSTLISSDSVCKDTLRVSRLPNLPFETQPLELRDDLVIVMNRDPLVHESGFVHTVAHFDSASAGSNLMLGSPMVLIIRSANEISRDLRQAMECYDDIMARKQLASPKGFEVHLHQDNTGHPWGRLDCLGKKGMHSREVILDAYGDHVRLHRRFLRNKKITLIEKADIIFAALGIWLPVQHPSHSYPNVLYYINRSVINQSLITVINKRFEFLKSLYYAQSSRL